MNATAATTDRKPSNRRRPALLAVAVVAALLSLLGVASPVEAAVQTYGSSTRNGLWHSGNVEFYSASTRAYTQIHFNDRAGDAYCTQLKVRVYQANGYNTTFTNGSVCGGRTGTITDYYTAGGGSRLTRIDVWTVRADGTGPSYVWSFTP